MKLETEFNIDDILYVDTCWTPKKVITQAAVLGKLLGPTLGSLVGVGINHYFGKSKTDFVTEIDYQTCITEVFDRANPNEIPVLINNILENTKIIENGVKRPISFDLDFIGRPLHMMKVLGQVLKNQFIDKKKEGTDHVTEKNHKFKAI